MIPSSPIFGCSFTRVSFRCGFASAVQQLDLRAAEQLVQRAVDRVDLVVDRLRRRRRARTCARSPAAWRRSRSRCPGSTRRRPRRTAPRRGPGSRSRPARAPSRPLVSASSCMISGLRSAIPPQATISIELEPVLLEVVHDPAVAERDRLEQRAVDLRLGALQRQAEDHAGQIGVGEDRAVAVPPVERDQPGLPRRESARPPASSASYEPSPGRERVDEPREHVADRRLTRLVPVQARQDPVPHDAGDPGQPDLLARARPCRRSRCRRPSRTRPGCSTPAPGTDTNESTLPTATATDSGSPIACGERPRRSVPGARAERDERRAELLGRRVEAGIGGLEVLASTAALLGSTTSPCSRPCSSGGPRLPVSHQTIQSVASMNAVRLVVDLAVLEPQLDQLREVPLRGDPAAVARQELLAALERDLVEPVGDRLGGVVLPQLRPGVRPLAPVLVLAQRDRPRCRPAAPCTR